MMKLFLFKKLDKHVIRVKLSFPWDTFNIEKMIGDKMVHLGFLTCNINTDLFFRAQNFNI